MASRLVALLALGVVACATSPERSAPLPDAARPDAAPESGAPCGRVTTLPVADTSADATGHPHPQSPVPDAYRGLVNPYPYSGGDAGVLVTGRALYEQHCTKCHASDGHACGPRVPLYFPPTADLNESNLHHDDPYLFWRIHDGGTLPSFPSDMPAFGPTLTDDEIWQVIMYVRLTFVEFAGR